MTGCSPISLPLTITDTSCTSHFFTPNARLINVRPAIQSLPVTMPNGAIIYPSHVGELDLPNLAACIAHVFPDLASDSLLSIGQLCNAGCTAFFTKDAVKIEFDSDTLLTGSRSPMTRLWHTPIPPSTQHHVATGYTSAAKICLVYSCFVWSTNDLNPVHGTRQLLVGQRIPRPHRQVTQKASTPVPRHGIISIKLEKTSAPPRRLCRQTSKKLTSFPPPVPSLKPVHTSVTPHAMITADRSLQTKLGVSSRR